MTFNMQISRCWNEATFSANFIVKVREDSWLQVFFMRQL